MTSERREDVKTRRSLKAQLAAITALGPRLVPFGDVQELMREKARLGTRVEIAEREVARLTEELERLRPYLQHRSTCILNISVSPLRAKDWCDCGLTAALAATEPGEGADRA